MSEKRREKKSGGGFGKGHGGPPMGMPVEKAKDFKGTLKRLLGYLKPLKFQLVAVFIMAILSTTFTILSPDILGKVTTTLFNGIVERFSVPNAAIDFDYIYKTLIILAVLYISSAFFAYIQQYIMAGVAQKTVLNMRKDVNEKLSRLPLKFFDSHTHGEILSRVTNDVDNISSTLQQSITQLITSIITIVGIIIMMFKISPVMTLITLITLPLSVLITKGVASRSQKFFKEQQGALGELNGHVEEMYTGHKIVKAFGHESKSIQEFNKINEELYEAGWKAQFISGIIMPLITFVNNIGYVFVSVVGGILVTKKAIEIGHIQAFIQYSKQFTQPIVQTANIANIIQSTIASAERVFELLDEEEEIPDSDDVKVIEFPSGNVKFENVDFGYKEGVTLIEDMNIDVSEGQTIAIVGPTGAGKTTLVNLLMRFYEINDGKITIDGADIRELKREDLRSIFGMVLQDTWLFNGSIKDNIAYGREGASEEEIIRAAKAAHADHFIRTLPEGYDTILNEEASNISQGQKQLLTIARAILANPVILILDEATSSVDTRTEVYIQRAMTELMKGRTSFVIAHRLSTIRDADLILVMNNGSIIEKGNHDELLAKGGFYADLYNSQFTGSSLEKEII
ncbi:ABC transporter ATP-binding protein/permease [Clostridium sp. MSJ-11]|uniref:ABC transporter ATP-binding protein/permease n=1 Tax=Clostridium mobile TaxID=2841512 RepID=A0ABS6EJR6_9CLOT|nr:ABC transporter ATP-binding protein [Clostridium mobile]MBU5484690.1 ABC transporter ATP-binding protein/permease [Clostridium mobile]